MDKSIGIIAVCVLALASQAWSLAIKSDEERSAIKQSNDENLKRDSADVAAKQLRELNDLRTSYAMLLDAIKNDKPGHPFGFGLSRSTKFFGKRNARRSFDEDQNTSVFHGKRSRELAEWLANNARDERPSRLSTSNIFHGKKDMDGFMDYLLQGLDERSAQDSMKKK